MAKLDDEDVQRIVDAVMAELDRRKQIDDLANAIIRKQAEMNRKLMQAPSNYQKRQRDIADESANTKRQAQPAGQRSTSDGQQGDK